MLTIIFIGIFGALVLGFMIYVFAFGGLKRRGQSGEAEVKAQQTNPRPARASGKGDN